MISLKIIQIHVQALLRQHSHYINNEKQNGVGKERRGTSSDNPQTASCDCHCISSQYPSETKHIGLSHETNIHIQDRICASIVFFGQNNICTIQHAYFLCVFLLLTGYLQVGSTGYQTAEMCPSVRAGEPDFTNVNTYQCSSSQ